MRQARLLAICFLVLPVVYNFLFNNHQASMLAKAGVVVLVPILLYIDHRFFEELEAGGTHFSSMMSLSPQYNFGRWMVLIVLIATATAVAYYESQAEQSKDSIRSKSVVKALKAEQPQITHARAHSSSSETSHRHR